MGRGRVLVADGWGALLHCARMCVWRSPGCSNGTHPLRIDTHPSPFLHVRSLQDSLQLLQDPNSQGEAIRNGFILLGVLIFLRIWCYYALRKKTAGL